ncbi:MAG: hypothetical protein HOC91_15505 [Nitrospinaceae bacterium]|jgi:hypothetical protein|nr:hypothetical protein [Nitrospinaceae bacterium]MBT3434884.1 hypothetical protein [Nitrospinaceae bacterium]MBT4095757.1 hypothetical protein [Nitrospinaceae bacterium]MBT4431916.1 hypothetical protein [Nitrospinaceae bacterium]MBT5947495.1 hypothetical protein [Nitrospinaceae bacterium]
MSRPYYKPDPIRGGGGDAYIGVDHQLTEPWPEESRNVRLVAHSDLNGWGDAFQIQVGGGFCYVAASGVNGHDGMTILDVKDPSKPKIVNQLTDSPAARTHKVLRINDEVLITNSEIRPDFKDDPEVVGGLRVFDNTDPVHPKFINYIEVDGFGIHRPIYDRKRKLMYSSGFRDGYEGKVLLVHDMEDPWSPEFVGLGHIEGQKEGESPSWDPEIVGNGAWVHEGNPFGNYVTCGYWDAGIVMFDMTDPSDPKFMWRQNPHETHGWPGCYHSFLVPDGSEFAIVTHETTTVNCDHPPAFVTFYDMRNIDNPIPVSTFMPYETDPYEMRPVDKKWSQTGSRHGAHNVWLDMTKDDLMYISWFNAGLRIVDWSNPFSPKEVGYYIPAGNKERFCPQSNDVQVDKETGLIYVADRWGLGLHILEYTG